MLLVDRMLCVTDVGSTTGAADGVAIAPLVEPEAAIMLVAKSQKDGLTSEEQKVAVHRLLCLICQPRVWPVWLHQQRC